jgi:hypothetical protein
MKSASKIMMKSASKIIMKSASKIIRFPAAPDRGADEIDFLPAALEIVEKPPSPVGRAIGATIIAVACMALAWTAFGTVDIVAAAVSGADPPAVLDQDGTDDTGLARLDDLGAPAGSFRSASRVRVGAALQGRSHRGAARFRATNSQ